MPAVAGMTKGVAFNFPLTHHKSVILAKARTFVDGARCPPPRA